MNTGSFCRAACVLLLILAGLSASAEERVLGGKLVVDQEPPSVRDDSQLREFDIGVGPYSISPKTTGFYAPEFSVVGTTGNRVNVKPRRLNRPLVLTFFRGGWCPYCQTQFSGLRKIEADLSELGYDIWFVSPDRPELLSFGDPGPDGAYQIFSDTDLSTALAFGVAYQLESDVLRQYFSGGAFLRSFTGQTHTILPVPSTFIIANTGEIVFQYSSPDHTKRIDPGLLLAAAQVHAKRSIASHDGN